MGCSAGVIAIGLAKKLLAVSWRVSTHAELSWATAGGHGSRQGSTLFAMGNLLALLLPAGAWAWRLCAGGEHREHHAELVRACEGCMRARGAECACSAAAPAAIRGCLQCMHALLRLGDPLVCAVRLLPPSPTLPSPPLCLLPPTVGITATSAACSFPTQFSAWAQVCCAGPWLPLLPLLRHAALLEHVFSCTLLPAHRCT